MAYVRREYPGQKLADYLGAVHPSAVGTGWVAACDDLERASGLPELYTARWLYLEPKFNFAQSRTGVSAELIAAVAWVESRWQRTAVSPKGARGVMQLMPKTGAAISADLGIDPFDPFDATQNILVGAEYLRRLIKRWRGKNPDWVYASYYAGGGTVAKYGPGRFEVYVQRVRRARAAVEATKQRCAGKTVPQPGWPYRKKTTTAPRPSPRPRPGPAPSVAPPQRDGGLAVAVAIAAALFVLGQA